MVCEPAFNVNHVDDVIQEPKLEFVVLLAAGSEGGRRVDFNEPSVNADTSGVIIQQGRGELRLTV